MRAYLALAAILVLIGVYWLGDHNGVSREHDRNTAASSGQKDKVQTAIDLRDQSSATARLDMLDMLRVTIPPLEIKAHEAAERIRVVYRSLPADACVSVRPDRVQDELNAARDAANSAIGAVRRTTPDSHSTGASMAGYRPMGYRDDESVPTGSGEATGDQRMLASTAGIRRHQVTP